MRQRVPSSRRVHRDILFERELSLYFAKLSQGAKMDWLTFISNAIASLAWPTALLVVVVVLRQKLGNLVGTLRRLKWRDLEAEFGQELKELEAAAKRLPLAKPESTMLDHTPAPSRTDGTSTVKALARLSPSAALLTSWIGVEEALSRAINRLAISADPPSTVSPLAKIELLQQHTNIDQSTLAVLHRLRELRNRAAHSIADVTALSPEDAVEYHNAALRAVAALDRIQYVPQTNAPQSAGVPSIMPRTDARAASGT